jgi:hypothetical protein
MIHHVIPNLFRDRTSNGGYYRDLISTTLETGYLSMSLVPTKQISPKTGEMPK